VGQAEFRLRFKPDAWERKIDQSQLLADGTFGATTTPPKNKAYCTWLARSRDRAAQLLTTASEGSVVHSLEFKKQNQSGISAVFEMQSDTGAVLGVLDCVFVQSQTPADISVAQWQSIVGSNIGLESHSSPQ